MNELDFVGAMIAKPHFYRKVISVLGNDVKHMQVKRAMANGELFERFTGVCNRKHVTITSAIENRRTGDHIVYIRELDLYGLCEQSELAHLSLCLKAMQTADAYTFVPLFDFTDRPVETLSANERILYDEYKRRQAIAAMAEPSAHTPKVSVYQVILACDACKLVFYCMNPIHVDTIKRKISERWAASATSITNADGEVEITVDSKHANFEEARKFYTEITNTFSFSDLAIAKSMREMFLTNNGNGIFSWMASFDAKLDNIVAQIKTVAVNNTIGTVHGNVIQSTNSSAGSSSSNPEQIASEWIVRPPPRENEGSREYFRRYCDAITGDHITNRKMFNLLMGAGFIQIKTPTSRLWKKL